MYRLDTVGWKKWSWKDYANFKHSTRVWNLQRNKSNHGKSQETFYAQTCSDDVISLRSLGCVYQSAGILVKHDMFATCQKSRIQDHVLPVEKNWAKANSFIIRSIVVQQRIVIIAHTALSHFHWSIICNGMYNNNIRRIRKGLLVQNAIKYSQIKREWKLIWKPSVVRSNYATNVSFETHHLQDKVTDKRTFEKSMDVFEVSKRWICFFIYSI